jgi:hypothetical protein
VNDLLGQRRKEIYNKSYVLNALLPVSNKIKDITNFRFNKLCVLGFAGKKERQYYWFCECDCGNIKKIRSANLFNGTIKTCGCRILKKKIKKPDSRLKHGHSRAGQHTETYSIWKAIIQRCNNPKNTRYNSYGNRGIAVCQEWLHFENFLKDMGERPKGLSIDRINNDGNYCKENCRWATIDEQMNNRQNTLKIEYNNKIQSLKEWSVELNISYNTLYARVQTYGWTIEKAFTKKIQHAT